MLNMLKAGLIDQNFAEGGKMVQNLSGKTRFALAAVMTLFAQSAFAGPLLFDNADPPLTTTFRTSGDLPGTAAYLQIGALNVTISQIAINAAPGQNGNLKFFIFDDVAPPGNSAGPLEFTDTVSVLASGSLGYILSDVFSFNLLAGHYYDIGAIFDGSSINYSYDLTSDTQNGITSIVANQNATNFTNPVLADHAGADINIRLFGGTSTTVPEPSTLGLFGAGLAGLYGARRRRKSRA